MSDIKFACPHCQQHIQCELGYAGMEINCPTCSSKMLVPRPAGMPAPAPSVPAPAPAPAPSVSSLRPAGLSIAGRTAAPAHAAAPAEVESESADIPSPPPVVASGPRFCKFHPKSIARYQCHKCNRTFCDLCVTTISHAGKSQKKCRSCGVEVMPLKVTYQAPVQKSFFSYIPGAFVYPVKGGGWITLLFVGIGFGTVDYLESIGFGGIMMWALYVSMYGFLFLFMQNIINSTVSDENEPLSFPEVSELGGAAFQLVGTVVLSFGLFIGLLVAYIMEVPIPIPAIIAAAIFGCVYFPMALLAVAIKDTVAAANPLVVLPAILKIPLEYFVASILLTAVFAFSQVGDIVAGIAFGTSLTTKSMAVLILTLIIQGVWAFVSVYLIIVNTRILGALYLSKQDKLGWE